jgi:hypothetical protein
MRLATTCPVSSAARAIGIVRKRLTMPPVMSTQTDTEVDTHVEDTVIRMMPGAM